MFQENIKRWEKEGAGGDGAPLIPPNRNSLRKHA